MQKKIDLERYGINKKISLIRGEFTDFIENHKGLVDVISNAFKEYQGGGAVPSIGSNEPCRALASHQLGSLT